MRPPEGQNRCPQTGEAHNWLELPDHPNPGVETTLVCVSCCYLIHRLKNGQCVAFFPLALAA